MLGTVKFFDYGRKFGFIQTEEGEVFVHLSALTASGLEGLRRGQTVAFEIRPSRRGTRPNAVNVSIVPDEG